MATGDLANNIRKLQKEIKLIKYPDNVDLAGISQGTPTAFLPIYHYVFTSYSHSVAEFISASDTELFGKTDFRFIEAVYKIMRDLFSYKPPITKEQFFNAGYAERKIIMCSDVVQMIREKNKSLQPKKPTTSAVSTVSQSLTKKPSRPKSADTTKTFNQSCPEKQTTRPETADAPKQVKFTAEEVVNELKQPVKQHASRHVAHKDLPSPVAIVNMSPSVTKEIVRTEQHPSRGFKYAVVTPSVSKHLSTRSSRSGDSGATKGLQFDDNGEIEVVNATSPDTSLYEPLHNSTGIVHEEMQNHLSSLQHSVEAITERLGSFESAITSITTTMQSQQHTTDPKLLDIVTHIQQQIENLTARMVLMENRVSIVESKLQQSPSRTSEPTTLMNGKQGSPSYKLTQGNLTYEQRYPSELSHNGVQQYPSTKVCPNEENGSTALYDRQSNSTLKEVKDFVNKPQSVATNAWQSIESVQCESGNIQPASNNYRYSGNASIPPHMTTSDQFSFALSPIKDTSGFKSGPNATGEDTFALEAEDDARRSSTPTNFKDLPIKPSNDDSMSFHFGDVSTQQRVDRIKNLMASTQTMLKK